MGLISSTVLSLLSAQGTYVSHFRWALIEMLKNSAKIQARSHVSVVGRTIKTAWGPEARLRALGGGFLVGEAP